MNYRVSLDANVLIYIYSYDELHKSSLAREAIAGKTLMTSVQVLLENSVRTSFAVI
jgi:predicted nucleic acid-binding protein